MACKLITCSFSQHFFFSVVDISFVCLNCFDSFHFTLEWGFAVVSRLILFFCFMSALCLNRDYLYANILHRNFLCFTPPPRSPILSSLQDLLYLNGIPVVELKKNPGQAKKTARKGHLFLLSFFAFCLYPSKFGLGEWVIVYCSQNTLFTQNELMTISTLNPTMLSD